MRPGKIKVYRDKDDGIYLKPRNRSFLIKVYPYDKDVFKLKSMPTPREKREMKPISKFILKLKESTLCLDEDRGLDEDRFGSVYF
jgi:hypothetical protein